MLGLPVVLGLALLVYSPSVDYLVEIHPGQRVMVQARCSLPHGKSVPRILGILALFVCDPEVLELAYVSPLPEPTDDDERREAEQILRDIGPILQRSRIFDVLVKDVGTGLAATAPYKRYRSILAVWLRPGGQWKVWDREDPEVRAIRRGWFLDLFP